MDASTKWGSDGGALMNQDNVSRVVDCIAHCTRYPVEILTPNADLENDLGIDSVKRLEIVVALEKEFGVSLTAQERDPSIRTIRDITKWVEGFTGEQMPPRSPEPQPTSLPAPQPTFETPPQPATPQPARSPQPEEPSRPIESERRPISEVDRRLPPVNGRSHVVDEARVDEALHSSIPHPHFRSHQAQPERNGTSRPLSGKVALVTGSGRGVGRTIARVLAARGATVIVNSFHSRDQGEQTAEEINAAGGSAVHLWGSVANPRHVDEMFAQIAHEFGRLDILVCNASDGRIGSFMELTGEDWDRAFRTNVTGHHHCATKAAALMRPIGGGSIVTLSAVGSHGYIEGLGSQGVVKAAVETMTRYLACELGPSGIRVNCVAGGPVYGELLDQFPDAGSAQRHWESITPDGQLCSPMDLANAIAFLVGDEARGINGSVWMVDHGFSAMADGRPIRFASRERVPALDRFV